MSDDKAKPKDLSKWSTADLEKEAAELAKQRTAVRLAQNAVAAELDIRHALEGLNPEAQRVLKIRLGGAIEPTGEAEAVGGKS